jgi:hypothetical protein
LNFHPRGLQPAVELHRLDAVNFEKAHAPGELLRMFEGLGELGEPSRALACARLNLYSPHPLTLSSGPRIMTCSLPHRWQLIRCGAEIV